jgi:hypothetical protein
MRLFGYLNRLEDTLRSRGEVTIQDLRTREYLQRGFFQAQVRFLDGSVLTVVESGIQIDGREVRREKYVFHYQQADGSLIFRYDRSPHFPDLPTFPAHKHTPDGVIEAPAPDLADVLREIDAILYPDRSV